MGDVGTCSKDSCAREVPDAAVSSCGPVVVLSVLLQGVASMVKTDVMTLTRFMIDHTKSNPEQQDLEQLLASIQVGCGVRRW